MLARALRRGLVSCALTLAVVTPCGTVRAHGEPPTAYAVIAHDAEGALAVRLNTGLALRRSHERFQFVCPAAWGDEYPAPAVALDPQTMVVAAAKGLLLLGLDGTLRPHPDPAASGTSSELVRGAQGVFALRINEHGSEIVALDAERARVVWSDTKSWYSLAAFDDKLVVLRASGVAVEQLTLSSDGQEIERQLATVNLPVDYAFVRANASAPHALLLFQSGPQLGLLRMNAFSKIAGGLSSVAGPLALGATTLVAIDGRLSQLVNGVPVALSETAYVVCLDQAAGLAYACTPEGIAKVSEHGLADPVFKLAWLTAPNLAQLAAGKPRDRCDYQWQDMRFDLLALGTPLNEAASGDASDSGATGADPEPADAASGADASEKSGDPDAQDAGLKTGSAALAKGSNGCSVSRHVSQSSGAGVFAFASVMLGLTGRRRARPRLSR